MSVFKHAGVVVTTPSSGTYVIEEIGNIGGLADLLADFEAELGTVTPAPASATAPAEEGAKPARARGPRTTDGRRRPGAKREPSKTKAAIAAAKRRARVKAEREAAAAAAAAAPEAASGDARDEAAASDEEDVAEAAETLKRIAPHDTTPLLPPSSHAVPTLDEETPLDPTSARGSEAAALADALRRSSLEIGAVHAFDAKEAALCDLRGWSDVIECEIHRVSPRGVDVRCRVDPSAAGAFAPGLYRVPPNAALRVLGHREDAPARVRSTPSAAHGEAGVGGDSRVELARRRRVAKSDAGVKRGRVAAAAAAAAATPRSKRRRFASASDWREATTAAVAAARADADETSEGTTTANAVDALARQFSAFRRDVRGQLAATCASVERLTLELRLARGCLATADVLDPGSFTFDRGVPASIPASVPASVPASIPASISTAHTERSLLADERLLASLRAERRAEQARLEIELAAAHEGAAAAAAAAAAARRGGIGIVPRSTNVRGDDVGAYSRRDPEPETPRAFVAAPRDAAVTFAGAARATRTMEEKETEAELAEKGGRGNVEEGAAEHAEGEREGETREAGADAKEDDGGAPAGTPSATSPAASPALDEHDGLGFETLPALMDVSDAFEGEAGA